MNSDQYLTHCINIIKNDKSISEDTITIMFEEYSKKVISERPTLLHSSPSKQSKSGVCPKCGSENWQCDSDSHK